MNPSIGYFGVLTYNIAAFRLRAYIPSMYLKTNFSFMQPGDVNWFNDYSKPYERMKQNVGNKKIVLDITNNHLENQYGPTLISACKQVDAVTCSSIPLQRLILEKTGVNAIHIPDVYETVELAPSFGDTEKIVWFGHTANIPSVYPYLGLPNLTVVSKNKNLPEVRYVLWSMDSEFNELKTCNMVLLTTQNKYCSANRIIKALRVGKFVITPNTDIEEWSEFKDYMWIGDVEQGIKWAKENKDLVLAKIKAGQDYIRNRYHPVRIARKWESTFLNTLRSK